MGFSGSNSGHNCRSFHKPKSILFSPTPSSSTWSEGRLPLERLSESSEVASRALRFRDLAGFGGGAEGEDRADDNGEFSAEEVVGSGVLVAFMARLLVFIWKSFVCCINAGIRGMMLGTMSGLVRTFWGGRHGETKIACIREARSCALTKGYECR